MNKAIEIVHQTIWEFFDFDKFEEPMTDKDELLLYVNKAICTKLEEYTLTDKEQRIFLKAMEREREVCKEVDEQYTGEPYEDSLVWVCNEIERKVKKVLWE